ncbi:Fanconi anemia core complex-associated protein 20 isoform X2 [Engystomops pustulosus]
MSEERSAKLKLKRKKCVTPAQSGKATEVKLQPSSAPNVRQDFTGSWFDEIELTAAEQIWKRVLNCVYPDLSSVDWGALPCLPDVNLEMCKKEVERVNTEVFKVGDVDFEWVALPPAFTVGGKEKSGVPESEDNLLNIKHMTKPKADKLPDNVQQRKSTELLSKEGEIATSSEDLAKKTGCPPTPQTSTSTKNVLLHPQWKSQCSTTDSVAKINLSSKSVREPQKSQKVSSRTHGSTKHTREPLTSQKPNINLWATVTSMKSNTMIQGNKESKGPGTEAKPRPNDVVMEEASEGSSTGQKKKESIEKSADTTGALDSCPICLMQFTRQFSQLDMDSHLAQCLSETTVDVVW